MSWNSVPQPLVRRSRVADASWISVVSISSGAAALSSWILAPYSVQFLKLHWPTLNDRLPEWTLLGVTALFSLVFLNTLALYFMAPHPGRAEKLSKRESVLFGEPVAGAKHMPKPEPAPVHLSPITPPEAAKALPRYTPGSGTGGYLPSSGYGGARSPLSPANMNTGARVLSPYSPSQGAGMTTPEKMAGAVPDFNLAAADGGAREPPDATPAAGLRAGSLGQAYPGADASSQWRLSPYSSSPQGSPYYTPGQPSKYHYSAAALQEGPRRDGELQPSTQKQQEKVLIRLSLTAEILDQWTEALRGWLSSRVVRPLAAALGCPFPQDVTQGPQPEPLQRHIRGLCQRINQETAKLQKQVSAAAPSTGTTSLFGAAQQPAQPPPIMSEDELPAVVDALDAPDQAVQRQMELLAGGAQQVAAWAAAAAQRAASRTSTSLFGGFSSFGAPASTAAAASAPQSKALEAQAKLVAALAEQMCEACNKYLKLRQLVLGQLPGGSELLPHGVWGLHIVQRVQALASGHFLYHFKWNASTDHRTWLGAKPSQPPSDAALLLYLFGNYILHPRWDFPAKDELERPPRGDPLFVGSIPAQCPEKFVAVLPGSPPNIPAGSTALLAHNLTHHLPMYSLVLEGLTVLTLSHSSAVFHILLLMLRYCQQQRHGMVAGVTLKELGLEEVMGPVYRRLVSQSSWWGLWQS